ncbi:uncharacterized protein psda isoform X1 [Xiphophorus couchianus]|uniref:uncharacterized protein psda isoform X1 n=2 Tax=Xiphophorus couchianus TaxID=32473 RepID=UPI0010162D39|nr:uncharacterized protein LOC114138010 isoform X1 [Xiphophorus couchianus]XP_027862785.1 uncharacterized protein LOC114138010 isoform X1 [Xiphophorus couchianus]
MDNGPAALSTTHHRLQGSSGFMEVQQPAAYLASRKEQVAKVGTMSQPGKVLHLYVEVRSVSEEDEKLLDRGDGGTNQLMLQCPDLVPTSQRSSSQSSPNRSPDLSPEIPRRSARANLCSPKSSSRHSVSFQLQNPHSSAAQFHHQETLDESFDPSFQSSTSSHWLTVPSTYTTRPRSCEVPETVDEDGRMSLVSFGYIEKGSVSSMAGHQQDPNRRSEGQQLAAHLKKRMSDPMWYGDETLHGNSHQQQPRRDSSWGQPYLSKATMDAVARDATHRALEEFGSPELRRRFAGHASGSHSPSLPRPSQAPRCRSLGGSPVLPRSTLTLPSRTELLDMDRRFCHGSVNGLPRSPASDRLCAQMGESFYSMARPQGPTQSPQKSWLHEDGHRLPNKFHPPLPAGRPTDIQHEIPFRTEHQAGSTYHDVGTRTRSSHPAAEPVSFSSGDPRSRSPYHPSRCSSRTSDANSPISDRRSISPYSISDLDCKVLGESNRISAGSADRRYKWTPSPTPSDTDSVRSESPKHSGMFPKESPLWQSPLEALQMENWNQNRKPETLVPQTKPGCISPGMSKRAPPVSPALLSKLDQVPASGLPILDPRLMRTSSPSKDGSNLHRYQSTQHTRDHRPLVLEQRQHDDLLDGSPASSPEVPRRNASSQRAECPPGRWTSKGQTVHQSSSGVHTQSSDQRCRPDARGVHKQLAQECQLLVLGMSKNQKETQDHGAPPGTLSSSSSGVTGSLGHSMSPEPSSQSSHGTTDSGSGMQVGWTGRERQDWSTSDRTAPSSPSSRSQKIARAKWDFLFGGPTDPGRRSRDVSFVTPPTSGSPSPTPPSSLHLQPTNHRRGRDQQNQKLSHHEVQQVEVELVTPDPRGPAPKTGIIRRSIKYSETDLDAVPLRCYRETNLDEVMRAEAEAAEEADPGFSHSVLGKSCFSPEDGSSRFDPAGLREQNGQVEEDEEDEEEEGVASWASVRMQGDRQRQRAAREEDEVLSLLVKGTTAPPSEAHGSLKSPVAGVVARRPSESQLDSFSRHFENIMESHRAKGTSYSSLDSVDLLTSGSTSVFTFDLPTLTPEIQSQICESAKQILELSFAPLTRPESSSDTALGAGLGPPVRSRSEKDTWRHSIVRDSFRKATSVPALHSRERPADQRDPEVLEVLTNGLKPDLQAARRLAKRLYALDRFRKSDVAPHLSKNNDFSQMVAQEYLEHFNFSSMNIDQALRTFLTRFALMGETQERERVLAHFSRRYRQCNPETLSTDDSIHTLTCAVMLLNTDLHGNNVGKRMSCSQFISNLEGLNDGKDFPKDLLKTLYSSIRNEKLQWTIDEEELRKSVSELADGRTDSASQTMRRVAGGNPLVGVAQQADGELYKSGFLVRKVHADPDGKRTPRGKRGWKTFYAMLKGLVLYLQKDEYRTEREPTEDDVKNAVSVHHALAMRAADYRKRPNVFYLRTADWRVFLLQAPSAEQMQLWITRINAVAAMFSAPPFPAAIGSQKRFSRPLLPGSNTKLTQDEQLQAHENRFRAVSSELTELAAATPDRRVKGRELEEQKLRREYLEFEKTRYGTYAMLLRAKMADGGADLAAFEARLCGDGGLQRAHSSPSLPQDTAGTRDKSRGAKTSRSLKATPSSSSSSVTKSCANEGEGPKNGQRAELQKQSSKQEEVA